MEMKWLVKPRQLADDKGAGTGRWTMTARDIIGPPVGDTSHDHASAEEAESCERCDEFISRTTGLPTRKQQAAIDEANERAELKRLSEKYQISV